jgi:hypothetical protein
MIDEQKMMQAWTASATLRQEFFGRLSAYKAWLEREQADRMRAADAALKAEQKDRRA